jgi:hypothetical protein
MDYIRAYNLAPAAQFSAKVHAEHAARTRYEYSVMHIVKRKVQSAKRKVKV